MRTLIALTLTATLSAQELTDKSFDGLLEKILPKQTELTWDDLDWRPTFQDAVAEAREADKPILLWAMNGHPLGCV